MRMDGLCQSVAFPRELINEMRIEYYALLKRNSNLKSDIMMAPHQTKSGSMGVVVLRSGWNLRRILR